MQYVEDAQFCRSAVRCRFVDRVAIQSARAIQRQEKESGAVPRTIARILADRGDISEGRVRLLEAAEAFKRRTRASLPNVGPYRVIGRIARGGMGSVLLGIDERTGSRAAVKILIRNSSAPSRKRFLREAKVALSVAHPNIVRGIDVGRDGEIAYYAMEYVQGETLGDRLAREGSLSELQAISVGIQVARGLEFARRKGLVHRDVKPDNIIITPRGVVKLCDLGLARPIFSPSGVTESGMTLGTPTYISPEQARGTRDLDSRSDIYSLGITLFHCLAGRPPFQGTSAGVVISRHLTDHVPPVRRFRGDVNPALEEVLLKMTHRERRDRYRTPQEVEKDLWLARNYASS